MSRNEFTHKEDLYLIQYIGTYRPQPEGRSGNLLYEELCKPENRRRWPWARKHPSASWREHYVKNKTEFDKRIRAWQKHQARKSQNPSTLAGPSDSQTKSLVPHPDTPQGQAAAGPHKGQRIPFSSADDLFLIKYLAIETADGENRRGLAVYQALERFVKDKLAGSGVNLHPAQGWRERYVKRADKLDPQISNYQRRHGIDPHTRTPHKLWASLPPVSEESIAKPQGALQTGRKAVVNKHFPSATSSEVQPTGDMSSVMIRSAKLAGRGKGSDTESENEQEIRKPIIHRPRKRRASDRENDEDGASRKRRRVENLRDAEEEEEEEVSDQGELTPISNAVAPLGPDDVDDEEEREATKHVTPSRSYAGDIFCDNDTDELASDLSAEDAAETAVMLSEQPHAEDELVSSYHPVGAHDRDMSDGANTEQAPDVNQIPQDLDDEDDGLTHATAVPQLSASPSQSSRIVNVPQAIPPAERIERQKAAQTKVSQEPTPPTSDNVASPTPHHRAEDQAASVVAPFPAAATTARISHAKSVRPRFSLRFNDGFETPSPQAQSSPPRALRRKAPPVRVEGAFNSAITGAKGATNVYRNSRRVSGVDNLTGDKAAGGEAEVWPPQRDKGKKVARAPSGDQQASSREAVRTALNRRPPAGLSSAVARVNATEPFATDATATGSMSNGKMVDRHDMPPPRLPIQPSKDNPPVSSRSTNSRISGHRKPSAANAITPDVAPPRIEATNRRSTLATPGYHHRSTREKALQPRRSLPAIIPPDGLHGIDSPSIIAPNLTYDGVPLNQDDYRASQEFGMHGLLQALALSRGFSLETAKNAFKICKTIALTTVMLDSMAESAQAGAEQVCLMHGLRQSDEEHERSAANEGVSRTIQSRPRPQVAEGEDVDEHHSARNSRTTTRIPARQQHVRQQGSIWRPSSASRPGVGNDYETSEEESIHEDGNASISWEEDAAARAEVTAHILAHYELLRADNQRAASSL